MFDYMVVGAGVAGSVIAERLSTVGGKSVLVVERRNHVGGNAFDYYDENGLLVHKYGPHIFHTNSKVVFDYLSQFTEWREYQHQVRAQVDGMLVPIPINLDTINTLYGLSLSSEQVGHFFSERSEKVPLIRTSEDVVVSKVGRELFEKFYRGYTLKQWGREPKELDASVAGRVPVRTNRDPRYFTDQYQAMPKAGYTAMFERMLFRRDIHVLLNTSFEEVRDCIQFRKLIFTGPIDEYYARRFGRLPYRSLNFVKEILDKEQAQPVGTINYPNDFEWTRRTEMKHLTGQKHHKTALIYEMPCEEGDPYYPVPTPESREAYACYAALAEEEKDVVFLGRLGTYKYYNMDQVVAQALVTARQLLA